MEFPIVDARNYEEAKNWLYKKGTSERFIDDHERTETLKQVGTTLGPCFLVSGLVLFAKPWIIDKLSFQSALAIGALVLGIILLFLDWLKVTQQAQYILFREQAHQNQTDEDITSQT